MAPRDPRYRLEEDNSFTIRNYNSAPPFASFLPGIAGMWGIPMWAFYVNRGQGLSSFGLRDKDHAISEFQSANAAYELVFSRGFRTLLRLRRGRTGSFYEPFQMAASMDPACVQTMRILPDAVEFHETHREHGLQTAVEYFTVPEEPVAALIRRVTLKNIGRRSVSIQLLDGLAVILPFGLTDEALKTMRYLVPAYTLTTGVSRRVPCFRTKVVAADEAVVEETREVNFCFGFDETAPATLLAPVVDPRPVFGHATDLRYPHLFADGKSFRVPRSQNKENLLPCALLFSQVALPPGAERTFTLIFGSIQDEKQLQGFVRRASRPGYVQSKREANRLLIEQLTQPCAMASSARGLDAYARQNLLDNILRGGFPTTIADGSKPVVLSVFSRKHGDLERDYNPFVLEPTFFSQGDGNYRDVNQNRRHDLFLNPDIRDETVRDFFNLIQPDGFNPLVVKPKKFSCRTSGKLHALLLRAVGRENVKDLEEYVTGEFEPGRLFLFLQREGMTLDMTREEFLAGVMAHARGVQHSDHTHGYWSDHWTYNLDLLETFRGIYPERFADLLYRRKDFIYCDSHVHVRPRHEKYALWNGRPIQMNSLEEDPEKHALIASRKTVPHAVRTRHGHGRIYHTMLAPKLLGLGLVKFASLDPSGVGIEMEAERPNWCDALNGLPGQFGSSICETFELKRLLLLIRDALDLAPPDFQWVLPLELHTFFRAINRLLARTRAQGSSRQAFDFWDKATAAKEAYRASVRQGFEGKEKRLTRREVEGFLDRALAKVEHGIRKARDRKSGLYHSYFKHELTRYREVRAGDRTVIKPLAFRRKALPAYLEGQVHALRVQKDPAAARALTRAIRKSGLYDKTLRMYKVNASLQRESQDIGRARTFPPGWLENESIWLHMHYKYLLEILRSGLAKQFFEEFRHGVIAFMDPAKYGRSTTENSSFIVSEVYPDPSLVGRGFMARLSGATAEFVHMWILMCCGEYPFRVDGDGRLEAVLEPTLPGWLFTKKTTGLKLVDGEGHRRTHRIPAKAFAYVFLGHTLVIYRQKGKVRDTFGPKAAKIRSIELTYDDGRTEKLSGAVIPSPHAEALRNRQIARIRADLGQ